MTTYPDFLKLRGYSNNTIYNYKLYYKILNQNKINQESINQYLIKHNTDMARAALKSFMEYKNAKLITNQRGKQSIQVYELQGETITIQPIKGRRKKIIVKFWNKKDIISFADNLKEQDRIIVLLLFETGQRISEVLRIRKGDVNFGQKQILFPLTKSNKEQWGYFTERTKTDLHKYCQEKKQDWPLFEGVNRKSFGRRLKKMARDVMGLYLTPHMLKHSCATHMKLVGYDLIDIKNYLGHESITTLEKYAHITNQENLKKDFDKIMA